MSKIIGDTACPSCREQGRDKTGNHLMLFEDGGGYCNRCEKAYSPEDLQENGLANEAEARTEERPLKYLHSPKGGPGELGDLTERGIRADIAEVYNVTRDAGHHYYPITWDGDVVGYKVRDLETKAFTALGSGKTNELFGQHLLSGGGKVFITEGECDAMALAQCLLEGMDADKIKSFGFPPVVSVPQGVDSAKRIFSENQKLLNNYKQIVLVPDNDKQGKRLVDAAIEVFGREKLLVVNLPLKDPNDMLLKGQGNMLRIAALSQGKPPVPEEVVFADDIPLEVLMRPIMPGIHIPQFPVTSKKLHGLRYGENAGELTVVVSGSGMGKSTFTKEIMYSLRTDYDLPIGEIRLEESTVRVTQSLIAMHNNVPVAALRENPNLLTVEQWEASRDMVLGDHKVAMLDHFGSLASEKLVDHLKYLAYTVGCKFISLDHISMVVSGQENLNERKDIDILMTNLAAFVETSGVSVIAVVHLRRPSGDVGYNEGAEIALNSLRGSAGLEQLSHNVIALEGNQREGDGNRRVSRVLKNREWGDIGFAEDLVYYKQTGRFKSVLAE